jgi:hypothetical protein
MGGQPRMVGRRRDPDDAGSQLLAHDSGPAVGVPVILTGRLPGTSRIPRQPDQGRPDLDRALPLERRDSFLREALAYLA